MLYRQAAQAIDDCVRRGLAFIADEQLADGGFVSYSSTDQQGFADALQHRTTFFPSVILSALIPITVHRAEGIKKCITTFLLAQKSPEWSFNYWAKIDNNIDQHPYPDDLDDTFCALSALYQYDPTIFDGAATAAAAKLLIATETDTGGPYRTWLVDDAAPERWRDVDIAVNANVAKFLSLQGITLPNVTSLIEDAVANDKKLRSPYYPSMYPLSYFIASWYQGAQKDILIAELLKRHRKGHWNNPQDTALAISALLRLGLPARQLELAANFLIAAQANDGSWPAAAFCIDPSRQGKKAYAGAAALTTALCLEALSLYQLALTSPQAKSLSKTHGVGTYAKVTRQVSATIEKIESPILRRSAKHLLKKMLGQDEDKQIVLLPWIISDAIGEEVGASVLAQLASANLWGWMAYRVYDDFLDAEGEPGLLPVANVCYRQLITTLHATLDTNEKFHAEAEEILDRLEAANAWEVENCRGVVTGNTFRIMQLPDYGDHWQLADRSLGHTIAGLGVLYAAGFDTSSAEMAAIRNYFRHYLIARQLNDDMHDWEEDLKKGHVNAVGVGILRLWQKAHPDMMKAGIDLAESKDELQLIMWDKVVPVICALVLKHAEAARKSLQGLGNPGTEVLIKLVAVHEGTANETLAGRHDTLLFIKGMTS